MAMMNHGEMTVPALTKETGLSRATIYEVLPELMAGNYIDYRKEGRNAYYKPTHPQALFALVEQKKRETALLEKEMDETIKSLSGMYNLALKKPGVRFFEGEEGFKQALADSLTATEEIYTIVEVDAVNTYANDINQAYVKERKAKGINKKLLIVNTPTAQEYMRAVGIDNTDTRFLPVDMKAFHTGMFVYDNKVSYFTLRKDNIVAMIIEDKDIYTMHRNMFAYLWEAQANYSLSGATRSNT